MDHFRGGYLWTSLNVLWRVKYSTTSRISNGNVYFIENGIWRDYVDPVSGSGIFIFSLWKIIGYLWGKEPFIFIHDCYGPPGRTVVLGK